MMELALTIAYLLSALISGTIGFYTWQRREAPGHSEMAWLMFAATFWSITSALEWHTATYTGKVFWSVVSYLGSQTAPVFFFLFTLRFTRQAAWLKGKRIAPLFIIPGLSLILAATNPVHHLVWPEITLRAIPSGVAAVYHHGPWFWVEMVYAYLLVSWGVASLLYRVFHTPRFFSLQNRFLVLASLAPMLGNLVYAIRPTALDGADPTPIAFALTGALLGWAFLRYQLLNIYPIAREHLMEDLRDGIILIDPQQRIVDINRTARLWLGRDDDALSDLIGLPVTQVLTDWQRLIDDCDQNITGQIELTSGEGQTIFLEINASHLRRGEDHQAGCLIILHEITQRLQAEQALQARERFMTLVNEITSEALKASDTPALLQILADRMGELIHADGCHITLWDDQRGATIPMAASGVLRDRYRTTPGQNLGEKNMTRSVLRAGHALVTENMPKPPRQGPITTQDPTRSTMALPMIAGEWRLGAVLVFFNSLHTFTPTEIALGEQAAAQVALAVAKMRLLEDLRNSQEIMRQELVEKQRMEEVLQQRAQELSALYATSLDINSQLDLTHLLRDIVERAAALCGAQMGGLYLLRPDEQDIELAASYHLPLEITGTIVQPGEGVEGRVLQSGETLIISDYAHWDGRVEMFVDLGIQRVMGVPLKTRGQILGVLNVSNTDETGSFSEDQVRLVSLFADQASIAVENAHLFAELQAANEQLKLLATTDKATGAYNRRKYDEMLVYEISKAKRYGLILALVMFDIDHFKLVNDTHGHQAGDLALVELVKLVRENIRGSDWLVRWGGEEFMILAPGINLKQAISLAEKIRNLIDTHEFDSVQHISVSVGVTEYREGDSPETMTQRVDTALYQAKGAGRNCVAAV